MAKANKLIFLSVLLLISSAGYASRDRLWPARLGDSDIKMKIAESDEDRSVGLMFVKSMPENQGMLFVFEQERTLTFWMKNTLIPLSIGFFDKDLKLVDIQDMKTESPMVRELPQYPSRVPAQFALEMNLGWYKKHGVKPGAHLKILQAPPSPLLERFTKTTRPKSELKKSGD